MARPEPQDMSIDELRSEVMTLRAMVGNALMGSSLFEAQSIVSNVDMSPKVLLRWQDSMAIVSVDTATSIATSILHSALAARLDSSLLLFLTQDADFDPQVAIAMLQGLRQHREENGTTPQPADLG